MMLARGFLLLSSCNALNIGAPAMSRVETRCHPAEGLKRRLHDNRYQAFLTLQRTAREIRQSTTALLE